MPNSRMPVEDKDTKDHRTDVDPTEDPEEPEGPREYPPTETQADVGGIRPSLHRSRQEPKGEDLEHNRGNKGAMSERKNTDKRSPRKTKSPVTIGSK